MKVRPLGAVVTRHTVRHDRAVPTAEDRTRALELLLVDE
jgi:hypothetical protein